MGEWVYRFTFTWPRQELEESGQFHTPGALLPGKGPSVSIRYEVGWTPQPVWMTRRRENSGPYRDSNSRLSVVQPVASRYIDWSILAPLFTRRLKKLGFRLLISRNLLFQEMKLSWFEVSYLGFQCSKFNLQPPTHLYVEVCRHMGDLNL
jgi:hypothetical protein